MTDALPDALPPEYVEWLDEQPSCPGGLLVQMALYGLAKVGKLRGGEVVPFVPREGFASFVHIESV